MSNVKIKIEKLTKKYGTTTVLNDINLDIEEGKIYGLVGRNGSGKTMLLKCICGFVVPTSGRVIVDGNEIGKDIDIPSDMGLIIETPGFLNNYSGYNNLKFLAMIKGIAKKDDINNALHLVGLSEAGKKHVSKYSLGMRQRLGIAQAIMEDPKLLILDEPMNGLDNNGVDDIRKLLLNLKSKGKTVVLASHSKDDIELLCDKVIELDKGTIVGLSVL